MNWYNVCIGLHLLALSLWLGHMFVWSLIVGPAMKGIKPAATADTLRAASVSTGGLGWPALAVLLPTGLYLLHARGIELSDLLSGDAFQGSQGMVLAGKLTLVGAMIVYQAVCGHRPASIAVYLNMLAALGIIAASVLLVRGWI